MIIYEVFICTQAMSPNVKFQQDYLHRYIFNESYYYNHKYLQVDIYWDELCTIN
jgi:hypothetical protein